MRWIFKYDQAAAKYLGSLLHKKMPEPQPWLHVAVKTVSGRNPFSGIAIYVWDSRQVIFEYRQHSGTNSAFDKAQFTKEASGMTRAFDNREPLVGGRKDINEFFEFGKEFDASHGEAFDGPERRKITPLYKRRNAKMPGTESELSVVANNGGRVDLSKYKVIPYVDDDNIWYGIVDEDGFYYLFQDDGTMIDVWEDAETLIDEYNLHELVPANEQYHLVLQVGLESKQLNEDQQKFMDQFAGKLHEAIWDVIEQENLEYRRKFNDELMPVSKSKLLALIGGWLDEDLDDSKIS